MFLQKVDTTEETCTTIPVTSSKSMTTMIREICRDVLDEAPKTALVLRWIASLLNHPLIKILFMAHHQPDQQALRLILVLTKARPRGVPMNRVGTGLLKNQSSIGRINRLENLVKTGGQNSQTRALEIGANLRKVVLATMFCQVKQEAN